MTAIDTRTPAATSEDLRSLIALSWQRRHANLARRISAAEEVVVKPSLRHRLFQQVLRNVELLGGNGVDRERIRGVILESPEAESLSPEWIGQLEQELYDEINGLGPVAQLLRDPTVSDVLINGPREVWVDRFGKLEKTAIQFDDEAHLRRILRRMVASQGRRLDESSPTVDVRLPDGSRLNAVLAPVSLSGTVVSIRRTREASFRLDELIAFGTLTVEMGELLNSVVRRRRNIVISGGAGAGKTTLLNVLSRAIPEGERVVTIEETAELRLEHPHVISLEARPANTEGSGGIDLRTLVKNALRMRSDRIVVGEVRGAEAFDMLQAMHVGHDGSLTTLHANSPRDALRRLQSLVLMGGGEQPADAVNELIASTVNLVVQVTRFSDGLRRVTSIAEISLADHGISVRELFTYDPFNKKFEATPARDKFVVRLGRDFERESSS